MAPVRALRHYCRVQSSVSRSEDEVTRENVTLPKFSARE